MKTYHLGGAMMLLALIGALAGCGSSNSTPQGRVRIINALVGVPNSANIDVNVNNGQGVSSNIPFGQVTTTATTVDAGASQPVSVSTTGTTNSLITGATANVTQGVDNLLLVTGVVGNTTTLQPKVVSLGSVDLSNPPVSNQARIYFVNGAPGSVSATNFTLTVTNVNGAPATSTASATNLDYGTMSPAQLVTITDSSSTQLLTITTSGQTVTLNSLPTSGGHTYAIVLTGRPTSAGGVPPLTAQIIRLDS